MWLRGTGTAVPLRTSGDNEILGVPAGGRALEQPNYAITRSGDRASAAPEDGDAEVAIAGSGVSRLGYFVAT